MMICSSQYLPYRLLNFSTELQKTILYLGEKGHTVKKNREMSILHHVTFPSLLRNPRYSELTAHCGICQYTIHIYNTRVIKPFSHSNQITRKLQINFCGKIFTERHSLSFPGFA